MIPEAPQFVMSDDYIEAIAWDRFLGERPDIHTEQTTVWGRLRGNYGWRPTWVWAKRGGKICGGAMILTRPLGPFATIGYVERGPVWNRHDPQSLGLSTEAVCRFARSRSLTYLVVAPPYDGEEISATLQAMHFHRKPESLPPTGVGRATLLIDLQPDLDMILASMSMTKRQNIRRGLRKGVKVRIGNGEDVETVRMLMWQSCQRRGIAPSPPQKDYFDKLWRLLGPTGGVKFLIAEVLGEPVSAACVLLSRSSMQLWRVGWSGKHDDCDPNDVLHWEAIKWAKENGYSQFDFMHIRPDHAHAILSGYQVRDSYSGVTDYKMGFGGQLRLLPELYYRSFHPIVQSVLRLGGARALGSEASAKLISRIARLQRASAGQSL